MEFKLTNITEKDREFVIREGKTKMADQSGVDHLLDHFVYGNEPKKGDLRQTLSSSIPLQLKAVFSDIDPNTTTIPVFRIHMERPGYPQDKIVIDFRNAPIELSATP